MQTINKLIQYVSGKQEVKPKTRKRKAYVSSVDKNERTLKKIKDESYVRRFDKLADDLVNSMDAIIHKDGE